MLTFGLHKKIFIMTVLTGLILLLTLVITVSGLMYKFMESEYNISLQNQTQQICNTIDASIDKMKMFVMITAINEDVVKLMNGNYDTFDGYLIYKNCYKLLRNIISTNSGSNIDIYCNQNSNIISTDPSNISSDYSLLKLENRIWYKKIQNSKTDLVLLAEYSPPGYAGDDRFAVALRYQPFNRFDNQGIIIYSTSKQYFTGMLLNTTYIKQDFIIITDENNRPIYSSNAKNQMLVDLDEKQVESILKDRKNIYTTPDKGIQYKVDFKTSPLTGWKIIGFYGQERLHSNLLKMNMLITVITALGIGIMIAFSYYIARRFTKPLSNLANMMKKAEAESYSLTTDINYNDEIGELSVCFNHMMKTIRENQVLRNEAQIEALQQQMNPHFFYNTLESIKALAAIYGVSEIEEITDKMSGMFRYNVTNNPQKLVEISEEISHVMNYISIQKIRFKDRLSVKLDWDSEIFNYSILKFTLQPIAENALRHGIEKMQENGLLAISGFLHDGSIIIEVTDNYGMDETRLNEVRSMLENNKGNSNMDRHKTGIGLRNVQERIKLFYGYQYGLSIESEKGKGTRVTVTIPANRN